MKRNWIFSVCAGLAAIVFFAFWLGERTHKPAEVVKEVEKIKEVPAPLTAYQLKAINFYDRYLLAPIFRPKSDEALYKLDSFKVDVGTNDAIEKVAAKERIKNKFELVLRLHNIRVEDNASNWLIIYFDGLWDQDDHFLTYAANLELREFVTISHKGDLRRGVATIWDDRSIGYAGSESANGAILKRVEEMAESFAETYLAAQQRDK